MLVLGTANGVFSAVSAITGQSHAMILGFGVAGLLCAIAVAWIGFWERTQDQISAQDLERGKAVYSDPNFEFTSRAVLARMLAPFAHASRDPHPATRRIANGPSTYCSGTRRGQVKRRRQNIIVLLSAARLHTLQEAAGTLQVPGLGDVSEIALEIVKLVSGAHSNKRTLCRLAKQSVALTHFIIGIYTQRQGVDGVNFLLLSSRVARAVRILEQIRNFTRMAISRDSSERYIFVEADREVTKFYLRRLATYRQQLENDIIPEGISSSAGIFDHAETAETEGVTSINVSSNHTEGTEEPQKIHLVSLSAHSDTGAFDLPTQAATQQQDRGPGDEEPIPGRIEHPDHQKTKRPRGACAHCKKLKMRCTFETDASSCKRCLIGDRECIVTGRKPRCAPSQREGLLAQIQAQRDTIEKLMAQLTGRDKTEENQPPLSVSDTQSDAFSSSVDTPSLGRISSFGGEPSSNLNAMRLEESKAYDDWINKSREPPLAQLDDAIGVSAIHRYTVVEEEDSSSSDDSEAGVFGKGGVYATAVADFDDKGFPTLQTSIEGTSSDHSQGPSRSVASDSALRRRRPQARIDGEAAVQY